MNAFFTSPPQFYPFISSPEAYPSTLLPTFSPSQLTALDHDHAQPPTATTATANVEDDSSPEAIPPRRVAFDAAPSYLGAEAGSSHGQINPSQPIQYAIAGPGPSTLALNHITSSLPSTTTPNPNPTRTLNPLHLRLDHLSVHSHSRPSIPSSSTTSQAGGAGGTAEDRKRRVRSGCLTCRIRKVKCDEVRPRCKRCIIASRDCSWPPEQAKQTRSRSSKGGNSVKGKHKPPAPPTTLIPLTHSHMAAHHSSTSPRTSPTKSLITTTSILQPRRRSDDVVVIGAGLLGKDRLLEELVPKGMRPRLLSNPSFLHSYFPSVDEKLVIHHYINETVRNIVALDVPPTNPWIEWHAPMAFSVPRGSSLACDALQLAMLSIGAIHLRYLAPGGAPPSTTDFARSARARTLAMLRRSIDISTKNDESEIILGALLSCMISSSLAGDDAWQEILTLAASLIDRRGGIEIFLSKASRSHQSSFRFLMEQLATRDVFGCLTTGVAPTFLSTGFSPWWFEVEGWSAGDEEWESVERMFGISRAMVDLMARVCTVVAEKRLHGFKLHETRLLRSEPDPIVDGIIRVGQSHDRIENEEQATLEVIANDLLEEIEVWKSTSHFRRAHPRVQYGNYAHLHAMKIHLLKNAFDVQQDERIHQASRTILELCTETVAMFGRVVWMTWPVLMAGLHLPAHETQHRQTIRNLLLEFAPHAFFDNKLAVSVLQEYWSKVDDGINADWWSLTRELGRAPFFD